MGCPAKKVCNKAAGSALLKDEPLVLSILQAVVSAVDIPVTLKIRTGWSTDQKNAETVARMAEDSGIQALAIHGRTRACGYKGEAEYDTIANVRKIIEIPLFANGDISSPEKAKEVLSYTGADAVMIGRTAQGNPWIFKEIDHYLRHNERLEKPALKEVQDTLLSHLAALHQFYGEYLVVRIARKHVGWYLHHQPKGVSFRAHFNQLESAVEQVAAIEQYFKQAHVTIAAA
jgi:tRNA-dihydrouridine synthase B